MRTILSAQFFCEPKTALKNKVYLKGGESIYDFKKYYKTIAIKTVWFFFPNDMLIYVKKKKILRSLQKKLLELAPFFTGMVDLLKLMNLYRHIIITQST